MKKPEDFSVDDVCVLFVSLELGHLAPKIRENVVDGPLLLSLTEADFVNDLGLSGLQTKRVLRGIELAKQLSASGGSGGEELAEARDKIHRLEKENRELKDEVMNLRAALQPEPAPKQPSQQQQQQQYYQQKEQQQQQQQKHHSAGAPVVREAAKGTAKGAILGAVAGAVAGTY
jgi:regulator of replication initiation timing